MRTCVFLVLFMLLPFTLQAQEWQYVAEKDEMTDEVSVFAGILNAEETAAFGLQAVDKGYHVAINVMKPGWLIQMCQRCKVKVRLDSDPAFEVYGYTSTDNKILMLTPSRDSLVYAEDSSFIQNLLKAKTIKIAVSLYGEGTEILTFTVSGLNKDRIRRK